MASRFVYVALAGVPLVLNGCSSDAGDTKTPTANPSSSTGIPSPLPARTLEPAAFASRVTNPWYPLTPGMRWTYRGTSSEGSERNVVEVTDQTRRIEGVQAVVVHDRVWDESNKLIEDTWDWFAQDLQGNVWYLGEDTTAYEEGKTSKEGSWEAGVDGAEPGLVMPAEPKVGQAYPQEFKKGEAEDRAQVIGLNIAVTVPFGSFSAVQTRETTPLEPGLVERKYYARGIGVVAEDTLKGGDDRSALIDFEGP
jgi:hypothetical protein